MLLLLPDSGLRVRMHAFFYLKLIVLLGRNLVSKCRKMSNNFCTVVKGQFKGVKVTGSKSKSQYQLFLSWGPIQ